MSRSLSRLARESSDRHPAPNRHTPWDDCGSHGFSCCGLARAQRGLFQIWGRQLDRAAFGWGCLWAVQVPTGRSAGRSDRWEVALRPDGICSAHFHFEPPRISRRTEEFDSDSDLAKRRGHNALAGQPETEASNYCIERCLEGGRCRICHFPLHGLNCPRGSLRQRNLEEIKDRSRSGIGPHSPHSSRRMGSADIKANLLPLLGLTRERIPSECKGNSTTRVHVIRAFSGNHSKYPATLAIPRMREFYSSLCWPREKEAHQTHDPDQSGLIASRRPVNGPPLEPRPPRRPSNEFRLLHPLTSCHSGQSRRTGQPAFFVVIKNAS